MGHLAFYSLPEVYELAFSYRNVARECCFLEAAFQSLTGRKAPSALEMACGPGAHIRELHGRGLRVAALDIVPEMIDHLRSRVDPRPGDQFLTGDMAQFALERPVDLAFTLIDSLPYLTENAQLVSHLRSVRESLNPGGVYVIELRHPSDVWFAGEERSTVSTWTMEGGGLKVTVEWGARTERNPVTQVERVLTRLTVVRGDRQEVLESWGDLRPLLPQELLALVELAGGWRLGGWWGEFDLARRLGDDPRDWRMIVALQRAESSHTRS